MILIEGLNKMNTEKQFRINELNLLDKLIKRNTENESKSDIADNKKKLDDNIRNGAIFQDIEWLLNGSYGSGAKLRADSIIENNKRRRNAAIQLCCELVGPLEYSPVSIHI